MSKTQVEAIRSTEDSAIGVKADTPKVKEPSELDRILAQHNNGLGTIDPNEFFGHNEVEEVIRGAFRWVWQRMVCGVPRVRVAYSAKPNTSTNSNAPAPAPGMFIRYARYYQLLRGEQEQRQRELADDGPYQEAVTYWSANISRVERAMAEFSAEDKRSARYNALTRERAEYVAARSRIYGRYGVLTAKDMHEQALGNALHSPLSRLDELDLGDALRRSFKSADVPTNASVDPQYPYLSRYHGTNMTQALGEDCSFIYRPQAARAPSNFGTVSQGSYQPGQTAALNDYGTTLLGVSQQAPLPPTSVLEPVATRHLLYPFDETRRL